MNNNKQSLRLSVLLIAFLYMMGLHRIALGQGTYTGRAPTPQVGETLLSKEEIKAQYESCELGFYQGARLGKGRYLKDSYIWAVTPEFAKKFCMPKEFVSEELKGAEAVAFKLVLGGFGENCGFGGRVEVCSQGIDLQFEVYLSRDIKLPILNDVDFSTPLPDDSATLFGTNEQVAKLSAKRWQTDPDPGTSFRHKTKSFGLVGIQGNKVVWPITTLYHYEYWGKLYDGSLDLLVLQGSTGHFNNPRMQKLNIREFVIQMDNPDEKRSFKEVPLNEFAHVIRLPVAMSDQIQALDNARGDNWEALAKRALRPQAVSK